ncbi:MAG: AMP-binding protein, partial [Jannaschia sp.]
VLAQRFAKLADAGGWRLFIMYGQTEAGPRMSYVPPEDAATCFDTIGKPIDGGRFRLLGPDGSEVTGTDVVGELIFEGPGVMQGYALSRADLGAPEGPPVLHTGDMGMRLSNGYFRLTGRVSRFVKLFGLRVGLDEVEAQARAGGTRVHVTGTDRLMTIFVLDDSDPVTLRQQIATRYGLPSSVVQVQPLDTPPLLPSGKVDYRRLAQMAAPVRPNGALGTETVLRQALRGASLDPDRSFLDHGGDSLAYLEVQMHLLDRLADVPSGWEHLPLRDVIAMSPAPSAVPRSMQMVSADLVARVVAIFAVIALHSTAWPTGGGAYLLLVLVGYSLARFQRATLLRGDILQSWRSLLTPILAVYYVLIGATTLVWQAVPWPWFALIGNFQTEVGFRGLIPYWFVSTYAQVVVAVTLPFAVPAVRTRVGADPFVAGLLALAIGLVVIEASGVGDIAAQIRHRHPLAAIELLLLGWCACLATDTRRRVIATATTFVVWWVTWRDVSDSTTAFLVMGTLAVVWGLRVPVPNLIAAGLMWVGSLTLFVYVVHVPIISAVFRAVPGPDALRFAAVVAVSLAAAYGLKRAYEAASSLFMRR